MLLTWRKTSNYRMRVVEPAVPASCAIMSEEKSLNGSEVGSSIRKPADLTHSPNSEAGETSGTTGGRLKFFKDGKFIFELTHRKEGEKDSWIPVTKKSCWHPVVAHSTASLSASDDTSSVQLSPWQRDHCWKQSAPRRLRGAQLAFTMTPLAPALHARDVHRSLLYRLRRRPWDSFALPSTSVNGWTKPPSRQKRSKGSPGRLSGVVQRLWDIVKSSPSLFSPRKRILRELERVSLVAEEPVKRQRPRAPPAGHSKGVSSYSITSLLGPREEEPSFLRNLLRSPSPKSRQHSPLAEAVVAPAVPGPPSPYVYYPFQSGLPPPPPSYFVAGSTSHPLWTPYPLSSLPRGAGGPYAGLVPSYSSPHFQYPWPGSPDCELKREDTSSDVPLNLSKHGGS